MLEFNFFPKIVGEREGGENFFSGHKKGVKKIFPLFFKFGGHCTSDRPCQLIIFPIEKSVHEFFFLNFPGARIFFSVSPARFLFLLLPPPPPITFLMDRPLGHSKLDFSFPSGPYFKLHAGGRPFPLSIMVSER